MFVTTPTPRRTQSRRDKSRAGRSPERPADNIAARTLNDRHHHPQPPRGWIDPRGWNDEDQTEGEDRTLTWDAFNLSARSATARAAASSPATATTATTAA